MVRCTAAIASMAAGLSGGGSVIQVSHGAHRILARAATQGTTAREGHGAAAAAGQSGWGPNRLAGTCRRTGVTPTAPRLPQAPLTGNGAQVPTIRYWLQNSTRTQASVRRTVSSRPNRPHQGVVADKGRSGRTVPSAMICQPVAAPGGPASIAAWNIAGRPQPPRCRHPAPARAAGRPASSPGRPPNPSGRPPSDRRTADARWYRQPREAAAGWLARSVIFRDIAPRSL